MRHKYYNVPAEIIVKWICLCEMMVKFISVEVGIVQDKKAHRTHFWRYTFLLCQIIAFSQICPNLLHLGNGFCLKYLLDIHTVTDVFTWELPSTITTYYCWSRTAPLE